MTDRDPVQDLWVNQQSERFTMSVDEVRMRAGSLQSIVSRRNFREYLVGGVLIVFFTAATVFAKYPLSKLGCALTAIGVAFVMWRLHVVVRAGTVSDVAAAGDWAQFYRGELVRQRDALLGIWWWYLGPLIPGSIVYWLAIGIRSIGTASAVWEWAVAVGGLLLTAVVFGWVAAANKQAAAGLQAEIALLDRASGR
ncbi:MAG: hypothetical protein HOP13_07240 [Alphaproteobacteria bacterium]|nr:hypothetical protein [Alphaproteobacteria bacterium]